MNGIARSIVLTYKWAWQPLDSHGEDSYRLGVTIGLIRFAPILLLGDLAVIAYAVVTLWT